MMRRPMRAAAIAVVTMCLLPLSAQAQFTTYNSLAAYLAAVSAPGTDTYSGLSVTGVTPSPLLRTAGPYSYRASAPDDFFGAGTAADPWLSTNTSTDPIVFDLFSPNVRAIGGLFFGSDIDGVFLPGTTITLNVTSTSGSLQQILSNTTTSTFFGFVSTVGPITSLTVTASRPAGGNAWPTVDDLILATTTSTPITAVPEPATYVMLGAGLMVVAGVARKRQA